MNDQREPAKKKLIEVSIPLEAINKESAREKSIRHGHPSTMHLWWARRPLAAARAILFAQLVDDPSAHPEKFPTQVKQDAERARLHALMEKLIVWENSNDPNLLQQATNAIRESNDGHLPKVLDPFAGGGSIPLEAQRLGLEAEASDLNPVAVLLNKAQIEIPPRFRNNSPVNPELSGRATPWKGAEGLAADVRYYGQWMRDEAFNRIGHLYPKVTAPGGTEHTVIAWIWARTVTSPNPANPIETPLVRSWWLSKKKGKEAYIVPTVVDGEVRYEVRHDADGPSKDEDGTRNRRGGIVVGDGTPIASDYIKEEGAAGRIGQHLLAVVAEGAKGRLYISPSESDVRAAEVDPPIDVPDQALPYDPRNVWTPPYGLTKFSDLFTNRQLVAMTTLSDLVSEARERVLEDALDAGMPKGARLEDGGNGAEAYADAVATYLGLGVSRLADYNSSLASWNSARDGLRNVFARQAIPMVWDYAEANPFSSSSGNFLGQIDWVCKALSNLPAAATGSASQVSASTRDYANRVVSTDPPYYDNIGYSDLSDFFYVWLRRSLGGIHGRTLGTMLTPKADELVANPYRHDGKEGAKQFFVEGFNQVFARMREEASPTVPLTVYYAYKQEDSKSGASTGWHTLLSGLIDAGWEITGTWPMRSERKGRMLEVGTNALASSIVLVCRPRPKDAPATTRQAFIAALKRELPGALRDLMQGTIAPVDLAQAAIGPGISVFSRFSRVRDADGSDMTVRDALIQINEKLDDVLGEQESDFDPDTRFAVKWYRSYGWTAQSSGMADQLARASDTSIAGLERGGTFEAKGGKARLLSPGELSGEWDPWTDDNISIWEATMRLAGVLAKDGTDGVVELLAGVQSRVSLESVKDLGFLLYREAEAKGDGKDAGLFNGLVSVWGDVTRLAKQRVGTPREIIQTLDIDGEEI